MANTKEYKIVINGLTESISAVESLNKQLDNLEQRMKALSSAKVSVGGGSSSKGGNTSDLSEEERIQKEINKLKEQGAGLDAKIAASQDEIYKRVDATKQLYKETLADQKAIAAQERLTADAYSNTMVGMKQQLADIKAVIQTTDLGDSEAIDKMTKKANELTNKLKEMESAYGQFGRNVGNYANGIVEGLDKYKVKVGETTREFNSAKEAARTLSNELLNLPKGTKGAEELRAALQQVKSEIQDLGKSSAVMDNMLDTMEGFIAVANAGQGIRALFGVDDAEIQKSIKNLVALQNVLKGIETINKQINTREGIGKWIAPFTTQVDKATAKLLTFNTSLLGTGKAATVAAVGIKAFSKALKAALSAGLLIIVDLLVEKLMGFVETLGKADAATERSKKIQEEAGKAYAEASAKMLQYQNRIKSFNGSRKEEKKLVEDLNKDLGSTLGTYKSLTEWKEVLKKKTDAYIQSMILEAKQQAILNELIDVYAQKWNAIRHIHDDFSFGEQVQEFFMGRQSVYNDRRKQISELEEQEKQLEEQLKKNAEALEKSNQENGIGDYAPQIEKNTDKSKKALEEEQRTLNELQLRLMKDGLNKKLMQLDEEERQTLNKLKENGRKNADAIKKIESSYAQLRANEIKEYLKIVEESVRKTARELANIQFELDLKDIDNQLDRLKNTFEQMSNDQPIRNTLKSYSETQEVKKLYKVDDTKIEFARSYENLFRISEATKKVDEYYKFLLNYVKDKDKQLFQDISDYSEAIYKETDEERKAVYMKGLEGTFKKVEAIVEKEYANELLYVRNYTQKVNQTLTESFNYRLNSEKEYDKHYRQELLKNIAEQGKLNNVLINNAAESATEAEEKRYQAAQLPLENMKAALEEEIKNFKARNDSEEKSLEELKNKLKVIDDQMEQQRQQHYTKLVQITDDTNNKLKKNSIDIANQISAEQQKTFDNQITNLRDAQSKINEIMSKQPVYNKLGVVDVPKTKKQYKEIEDATKAMISEIIAQQAFLNAAFSKGLIKPEAMNAIKSQLNDLMAEFKKMFVSIKQESDNVIPKFIESMQVYVQAGMDSFNTIMQAVWDAQDNQFDKQQEQLDKLNEQLDKKLDEQEEIIQSHKDKIESIEDELATARGDRRQHLIDQLNAEMEAQRAAIAQEKKIQKEKEALQKKEDALELKRKKAQYKRDLLQAIVNGAMAVTMAAVNSWPIPAIPMMSLAASTTAAQIAIMAANKPYAKGGQLEGKSHAQGGIKVPGIGGGIELEGEEYVIRKKTTNKNIELLDYINRSERKLSLDDFIDFYGGKVKKSVSTMSPSRKFANGGTIPSLSTNIDISSRLLTAFEDYSNRPTVVQVVDVINRMNSVKNVQVLAGLSPDY